VVIGVIFVVLGVGAVVAYRFLRAPRAPPPTEVYAPIDYESQAKQQQEELMKEEHRLKQWEAEMTRYPRSECIKIEDIGRPVTFKLENGPWKRATISSVEDPPAQTHNCYIFIEGIGLDRYGSRQETRAMFKPSEYGTKWKFT